MQHVASESSFDVVSKVDRQEVDNALQQAAKEIGTRFDFRGTDASITWKGELAIEMEASAEERVNAVLDVFKDKLIKRKVSLKSLDAGEPRPSGKVYKIDAELKDGLTQEQAKKVTKVIREEGPKGVKTQVQGEEVRVSSKKRDDLQDVMALLKAQDFDFALQFTNRR
jgi:cyclic-di-GMP-binding protein